MQEVAVDARDRGHEEPIPGRTPQGAGIKLPGLRRQREMRCWAVADVARAAGITWATAAMADGGQGISPATARKILAALEANPPSPTAMQLVGEPVKDGRLGALPGIP